MSDQWDSKAAEMVRVDDMGHRAQLVSSTVSPITLYRGDKAHARAIRIRAVIATALREAYASGMESAVTSIRNRANVAHLITDESAPKIREAMLRLAARLDSEIARVREGKA